MGVSRFFVKFRFNCTHILIPYDINSVCGCEFETDELLSIGGESGAKLHASAECPRCESVVWSDVQVPKGA